MTDHSKMVVVLSNKHQYERCLAAGITKENTRVFCDNPRFYSFLHHRGIPFEPIDEYLLADRWDEINAWGRSQMSIWLSTAEKEGHFEDLLLPYIMHHHFSRMLIHMVKNYYFAQSVLEQCQPQSPIIVFQDVYSRLYPDFSGNHFLNFFLLQIAEKKQLEIKRISMKNIEKKPDYLKTSFSTLQNTIRASKVRAKDLCHQLFKIKRPLALHGAIMTFGPLRHLNSVLREGKTRGLKLVMCSEQYNFQEHMHALRHSIPYALGDKSKTSYIEKPMEWAERKKTEITASLSKESLKSLFRFQDVDLRGAVFNIIDKLDSYLIHIAKQLNKYASIVTMLQPSAVISHDDFSLKGGLLGAFLKQLGIPFYCLSHANLAVDFSVPEQDQVFKLSKTFVQSEFEKSTYTRRGWDPTAIFVTGTPRYDDMIRKQTKRDQYVAEKKQLKVLLCATGLWEHSPDQRGFLGCEVSLYKHVQLPAIQMILAAVEKSGVKLIIKPHSDLQVPMWRTFIKENASKGDIYVTSHSHNIFDLYRECDAMVLSYWSTALIEAALLDMPTIFVDSKPPHSKAIYEFAEAGFCRIATNSQEIEESFRRICAGTYSAPRDMNPSAYYLGPQDGNATKRVLDFILADSSTSSRYSSQLLKV